jgi:hypothetical protein
MPNGNGTSHSTWQQGRSSSSGARGQARRQQHLLQLLLQCKRRVMYGQLLLLQGLQALGLAGAAGDY